MELLKKQIKTGEKIRESLSFAFSKYKNYLMLSVISFFISRIMLPGNISPFSLPFIMASKGNLFAMVFSLPGILSNGALLRYKYILINIFGISLSYMLKWVFPKVNEEHSSPAICFISTFIFSLTFTLFTDYVIYDILLVLFESVISFLSYFVIKKGLNSVIEIKNKKFFTNEEIVTSLIIITIAICGIGNIKLPFDISIKNIVCITFVYLSFSAGNFGISSQVAAFMGLAAGISSDYIGIYVATFSVNTLCASAFSKHGKFTSVLGFILGNVIMGVLLTFDYYMVISFTEIAISSAIYIMLPDNFLNKIFLSLVSKLNDNDKASTIKKIATVKLDRLSIAFKKLSDTISSTVIKSDKTNIETLNTLFDAVSDKVCKKCALRFYCWQKDYDTTVNAMTKVVNAIKNKGEATVDDFPDYFKGKCVKSNEILHSVINLYELYRLNYIWKNKMKENKKIYREQFLELSDIVLSLKDEIEKNPYFDENLSLELSSELEKEGIAVKKINVIKDHNENMEIELILFPCQQKDKCYLFISKKLEEILDIPFYKLSGKCSQKECVLVFKESERYTLKSSVKQHTKEGSERSGDNYSIKTLDNSTRYIALCDGSGSGHVASEYSGNTLKLLEEFLKTGFSKSASIKLINSSLICNSENDYFSTIDLSIMDLKNGEVEIIKKGACPTYIKHANGEFEIIRNSSFPLGVIRGEQNQINKVKLKENDIIIMISDGIYNAVEKEDWILEALKAINSDNPDYISDMILKIATSTKNKDNDDMTVIASKVTA